MRPHSGDTPPGHARALRSPRGHCMCHVLQEPLWVSQSRGQGVVQLWLCRPVAQEVAMLCWPLAAIRRNMSTPSACAPIVQLWRGPCAARRWRDLVSQELCSHASAWRHRRQSQHTDKDETQNRPLHPLKLPRVTASSTRTATDLQQACVCQLRNDGGALAPCMPKSACSGLQQACASLGTKLVLSQSMAGGPSGLPGAL